MSYIRYNPKLKERARYLRQNSTKSEIILWQELKGASLGYTFNRQKPLDEYIVDFYCKKLALVIEVDGESHNNRGKYDQKRQLKLESLGLSVLRFYNCQVLQNTEGVIRRVAEVIRGLEIES